MKKISLTSLNIKGDPLTLLLKKPIVRYEKLCRIWNSSSYDVIQVQEIYTYSQLKLFRNRLKNYPYIIFKKSIFGPKGGLVTFSRIPLELYSYHNFSHQWLFGDRSMVATFFPNGILVSKFKENVFLMNTHFVANHQGNWTKQGKYYPLLKAQANEFQRFLTKNFSSTQLLIVSGDFNVAKKSDLYKTLKGKLVDIFYKDDFPTFHSEFLPKDRENNRIDFMFIKGKKSAYKIQKRGYSLERKEKIVSNIFAYLSDHVGLDAAIQIKI